uniref:Integrase catalytic domain-containing protein n=1 Tax=Steinernema glaseri TaxID=37863 RepID=A0A1I7Z763_9BILA
MSHREGRYCLDKIAIVYRTLNVATIRANSGTRSATNFCGTDNRAIEGRFREEMRRREERFRIPEQTNGTQYTNAARRAVDRNRICIDASRKVP